MKQKTASQPRRILVVDDEYSIRLILQDALSLEGYDARTAANGREALSLLECWKPDAIVLDLIMPEMDGPAFREAQRELDGRADIPVIVLSGAHDIDSRARALEAAAVLLKPFNLDDLFAAVTKVLTN